MNTIKTFLILSALLCFGCATSSGFIRPGTDFSKYKRIAVMPLADFPTAPQSGIQVADMLSMRLLTINATILDRTHTAQLLYEQRLGAIGLVDETTAPRIGQLLGVQAVIGGSVNEWQSTCQDIQVVRNAGPAIMCISAARVTLKLIDVETGQIVWAVSGRGSTVGVNMEAIAADKAIEKIIAELSAQSWAESARPTSQLNYQPIQKTLPHEETCRDKCASMYKKGELRVTEEDCIKVLCN